MLTIWRWGRLNAMPKGKPLGSFETWSEWCRDPLLALGCTDPVQRIETLKAHDPKRQRIADFFHAWWQHHEDAPIKLKDLDEAARALLDPHNRGRQYVSNAVQSLAGTHAAGFVLTRQDAAGKWGRTTYALRRTDRENQRPVPMTPMTAMPSEVEDERSVTPGEEATI
jgi:hypothetical protein